MSILLWSKDQYQPRIPRLGVSSMDYSSIISAVLISPFCSSSCCQACFPTIVRATRNFGNWLWRCSLIFQKWTAPSSSRCTFWECRRRWITSLETSYAERERVILWFSVNRIPFFHRWMTSKFSSLWFCFCLWSACKILHLQLWRLFFNGSSKTSWSLLVESITNLLEIWEILTQDWVVFTQRADSNVNSVFTTQWTGATSSRSPNLCPFGFDDPSLLGRVYSRQVFASNCSQVFSVVKYCPYSTTCMNPAPIQNLFPLFSCESLSIRSSYFCNGKFWYTGSSVSKRSFVLISLKTIDCPITISSCLWLIVKGFTFFTHFRDCSVKTEIICRNNYSNNSLNCFFGSAAKWIDSFPCPLLWSSFLDNGVFARILDTHFRRIPPASFPRYHPRFLGGYSLPWNTTSSLYLDK